MSKWTKDEDRLVVNHRGALSDLAQILNRSVGAIRQRRQILGVAKRKLKWTNAEDDFITSNIKTMTVREISDVLGRPLSSTHFRIRTLNHREESIMPRKSIYLPDDVMPIIGTEESGRFSSRLTGIIKSYSAIIVDAMPTLAEGEWLFICDMLNGCMLDERSPQNLAFDIRDAGKKDGLSDKWSVDTENFAETVDALPLSAKFATQEVAYKFWQRHGISDCYADVLRECGAKLK